ncbi:adenylate/guanylate cyclase domain-containing protein [Dietzia maris]|uniref:adenylate/guanylate cyclase domain-containing protein n=1 Tax=Dietzia maris TaxID=37915 RepID=UPI00223ADD22|nr:adenylate/guanylate cyclase domain-containing protein [Dietzia maris]MCT1433963.1 adenylate/guanylate cyclase domain-containing protein [Dietzia maris]MCT1521629.1 adenylate/guanylate cyclase domain-containing protein [Dietzia maris]
MTNVRLDLSRLRRPELGSVLLGREQQSARMRALRVRILLLLTLIGSNLVGVAVAGALILFVLPGPRLLSREFLFPTVIVVPVYVALATIVGAVWVYGVVHRRVRWFLDGREPSDRERVRTLRLPGRITLIQAFLWLLGAAVVTPAYGLVDVAAIPTVGFTIVFAGMVVCGAAFLFADFGLRPVAALALSTGKAPRARFLGAMTRLRVAWAVGSGVPIAGLIIVSIYTLAGRALTVERLAVIVLALGAASLLAGFLLISLATGSVLGPLRSVRWAMEDVTAGSLSRRVVVYDGTELGELQRGFNKMAAGLQERERLRDLFGRHVGRDVAEAAELQDPELGGQDSRVGVVFVDLIGSTEMAVRSEAGEVVDVLNRFFSVVVETVEEYDGIVDSFLGDAALVVFGAPRSMADPATATLACARVLAERLPARVPDCRAGIGASYGDVVAGYVGSDDRFEYTVIGDAVNEASRLCELAKEQPGLVLASGVAADAAAESERGRWQEVGSEVVRGRTEPTRLCAPAPD